MFNKNYYEDRHKKIIMISQKKVNVFLSSVFDFVDDQRELAAQRKDLEEREKASIKPPKVHTK